MPAIEWSPWKMQPGERFELSGIIVDDGDSVSAVFQGNRREIRLRGIDAPEVNQALGDDSTEYLEQLLRGRIVLELVQVSDRYGRVVGFLHRQEQGGGWKCVNVEMVAAGMAYAYREYGGDDKRIAHAEQRARDNRCGVWSAGNFGREKPWDNRNADPLSRITNFVGRSIGNLFS
jgi:micrococcal nuclease